MLLWIISALVVFSMLCGLVLSIQPRQVEPTPTPTISRPTSRPTLTVEPAFTPPLPTPSATATTTS